MSIFCSHDWEPRIGMDSGSMCCHCGRISERECIPSTGLGTGELLPRGAVYSREHGVTSQEAPRERGFFQRLFGSD